MRSVGVLAVVAVMGMATVRSWAGPKWDMGEDAWMQLSFLGQVHATHTPDAEQETDFFLRRGRVILSGQIMDGIMFFAETDNDNAGKQGTSVSTDIQDVFMDVRILDSDHWVKAGLILLPFSFETRASAASLLGIDYNSEAIKLANTFVWRDYGAELHGRFGKKVSYCAGVFDGYDSKDSMKHSDAELRYTGHVAWNLIGDAEAGWFYTQERRGKGTYLSLGAGYDTQDKATAKVVGELPEAQTTTIEDSEAWVIDAQSGFKVGPSAITVNGAYYDWENAAFKGQTAFVETGVEVNRTMLTGKFTRQDPDSAGTVDDVTVGLHYFMKDHNARGGIEYRWGDSDEMVMAGLQFLL